MPECEHTTLDSENTKVNEMVVLITSVFASEIHEVCGQKKNGGHILNLTISGKACTASHAISEQPHRIV